MAVSHPEDRYGNGRIRPSIKALSFFGISTNDVSKTVEAGVGWRQPPPPLPLPLHRASSASFRDVRDRKAIGLKNYGLSKSTYAKRQLLSSIHSRRSASGPNRPSTDGSVFSLPDKPVEELEEEARRKVLANPFLLLVLANLADLKVMGYFLVTWKTILSCALTVGLTCYWYFTYLDDLSWSGGNLDFILVAFAVVSPISVALGMAFTRRERALIAIADFRSFSYHLYLAHCTWDWPDNGGRAGAKDVIWVEHCDAVLEQLIGLGDELSRFLSLPTATKSLHRMTKQGRKDAARIMEVSYHLMESMCTQRMTRLLFLSERLKALGLPSGEASRLRQYERFLTNTLEQLRMVKMYRSPQALRSFARVFTLILPPFYAPAYAQVARTTHSLGLGIAFGIITALGLSALFEGLEIIEDPFTAYLALDGIDSQEDLEVLHFAQLISTRKMVFPQATNYPAARRSALTMYPKRNQHTKFGKTHERVSRCVPSHVQVHSRAPPSQTHPISNCSNSVMSVCDDLSADPIDLELGSICSDDTSDGLETVVTSLDRVPSAGERDKH